MHIIIVYYNVTIAFSGRAVLSLLKQQCLGKVGGVSRKGRGGVSERGGRAMAFRGVRKTLAFQGPFCLFKPSHHISSVYFILQQELIGILIIMLRNHMKSVPHMIKLLAIVLHAYS